MPVEPLPADFRPRPAFRDYRSQPRDSVRELYRRNHRLQTVDLVRAKRREFLSLDRLEVSAWDAMVRLDQLVDDSDPDIELSQLAHAFQVGEALRADGQPEWMIVAGFLHDMGKVLCLFGEPQWAVVGDTFPVGCRFSERIVYPEYFAENPDARDPRYNTANGIYEPGCGLDAVLMSWGHDEYLYWVLKDHLPEPALAIIRYHSFYAAHREGEYGHLMNDRDREMFAWVRRFNPYDLYTKAPVEPDRGALEGYYRDLLTRHLPETLRF